MNSIAERWREVQHRIQSACGRVGRDPASVMLVAVSKTFGPNHILEAVGAGIRRFGENRVQEAAQKIPLCPDDLEWHMVGHLQRNKVRTAVRLFGWIHSADSMRILETINEAAEEAGVSVKVLLEINVGGESSKYGFAPPDIPEVMKRCGDLTRLEIVGLMTVPPFTPEPEDARKYFRVLRELRERCQDEAGLHLPELSMGMSHDFEVAVEEGATIVRIGTAIFGKRPSIGRRPNENV